MVAVLVASHLGTFLLANKIDIDEWQKLGSGIPGVAVVLAAYKLWLTGK